jgi:hypothetical protein
MLVWRGERAATSPSTHDVTDKGNNKEITSCWLLRTKWRKGARMSLFLKPFYPLYLSLTRMSVEDT